MSSIVIADSGVIYDNPKPQLCSRHAYFPNVVVLPNGELLAAGVLGEAFESVDQTTELFRSIDCGETWQPEGAIYDKSSVGYPTSDCMKLTSIGNGKIVAFGYRFDRSDTDQPVGNPQTGGLKHSEIVFTQSENYGRNWRLPSVIKNSFMGPVEASAPITVLSNGSWVTPIANFFDWDGKCEAGLHGRLLRSDDQGATWDDRTITMEFSERKTAIWEQRLVEMEPGVLLLIAWNEDLKNGDRLPNHYAISTDNGRTFGPATSTGVMGQASSLLYLGDSKILSLHCLRTDTQRPGIYAYIVDLSDGKWNAVHEEVVFEPDVPISASSHLPKVFAYLKFGQPSAIELGGGDYLMVYWQIENGQGKVLWRRLHIEC